MGREQAEWTGSYVDTHVTEALNWSKSQYKNFQIFELSSADKATITKGVKPIIDDYVKRVSASGLNGDQIIKDVFALKSKYETAPKKAQAK